MKNKSIAVLGAGSWGTAVAIHLANAGHQVSLWGNRIEHVQDMINNRCNLRYLPNCIFPKNLTPVISLSECLTDDTQIIIAVPSHAFASTIAKLPAKLNSLAWLTKGIDPQTHALLSQLVAEKWGEDLPIAVISGPSFAREVAQGLPTALVIAGNQIQYLKAIQTTFHHHNMRVYLSEDFIGVQLCGAVKNVLAIACGISDGLHYGANAKAALITRGLAEMRRLGLILGAHPDTFLGLAGVGDLVLTCTDDQSRNRRFGLELGRGVSLSNAEKQIGQVVEGKYNAAQIYALATRHKIEMPICQAVHALLQNELTAEQAVNHLMRRPPKEEL